MRIFIFITINNIFVNFLITLLAILFISTNYFDKIL